jgi:hypothetical protein
MALQAVVVRAGAHLTAPQALVVARDCWALGRVDRRLAEGTTAAAVAEDQQERLMLVAIMAAAAVVSLRTARTQKLLTVGWVQFALSGPVRARFHPQT